jgi:hypothetical protein
MSQRKSKQENRPVELADLIKPGAVIELRHWHDADCPKPRGGECTCANGPEVEIVQHAAGRDERFIVAE